jgi:phage shock protein C
MNETKKLYRSQKNRMIAGVCGGLGEYLNVDAIIIRIVFVLMALGHGFGVLLYIILAIAIPNDPEGAKESEKTGSLGIEQKLSNAAQEIAEGAKSAAEEMKQNKGWFSHGRNLLGLALIIVGLVTLSNILFPGMMHRFSWESLWPLVLIFFGIYLIIKKATN